MPIKEQYLDEVQSNIESSFNLLKLAGGTIADDYGLQVEDMLIQVEMLKTAHSDNWPSKFVEFLSYNLIKELAVLGSTILGFVGNNTGERREQLELVFDGLNQAAGYMKLYREACNMVSSKDKEHLRNKAIEVYLPVLRQIADDVACNGRNLKSDAYKRDYILKSHLAGLSYTEIAKAARVTKQAISSTVIKARTDGSINFITIGELFDRYVETPDLPDSLSSVLDQDLFGFDVIA